MGPGEGWRRRRRWGGEKQGPSTVYAVAQRGSDWRARVGVGWDSFGGAGVAAIAEAHATMGVEPLRVSRREAGLDIPTVVGPPERSEHLYVSVLI